MAQYQLIDDYLGALRQKVHWRRDVDDLIDEAHDHLLLALETSQAYEPDPIAAQRRTLERFGDPEALADAFASTTTGGIAVPTKFTRNAGRAGIIAALAWAIFLAILLVAGDFALNGFFLLTAVISSTVLTVGFYRRHGGRLGRMGQVGFVVFGVGVASTVAWWAVAFWMGIQGIGMLLMGAAAMRAGISPRLPTIIYSSAFAIGAGAFTVMRALELGEPDEWGDYLGVLEAALVIGAGLFAIAALMLGRWLAAEEPAEVTPSSALMA